MSDTALTGILAAALDLEKTERNVARALASLRALLEKRSGRLIDQDGRPIGGDDSITLEV